MVEKSRIVEMIGQWSWTVDMGSMVVEESSHWVDMVDQSSYKSIEVRSQMLDMVEMVAEDSQ